jgi:AcrR family transcriptional regulator
VSSRRDARPAILEAAWRLLEGRGAGISLEDVARAAGVSRQAVYLHFENRNELLVAVTDHARERTGLARLEARLEAARTPRQIFAVLARLTVRFHRATAGVSLAVEALCREDSAFAASWGARPSGRLATAEGVARRLARARALAVRPVRRAADLVWALTGPSLYDQLTVRRGWSARAYERQLAALLAASLVRRTSPMKRTKRGTRRRRRHHPRS